jgi:hypothetical protein
VHETRDNRLTYSDWDKFVAFVTEKDAAWVLDAHVARGLPDTGFVEVYSRYAKALVAVGDGAGRDRPQGLETEFVARANPYTAPLEVLPVDLYYRGWPRANAQVEVFARAPDGTVEISALRTDGAGRVDVPVRPGYRYMLDAVVLREPDAPAGAAVRGAVWESLWANLTFAVPAR